MLVLCIVLIIFANFSFLIGFHNIDLAINIKNNPDMIDEGMFGVKRTVKEMYQTGLNGIFISFLLFNIVLVFSLTLYIKFII